jgi:hypothetical protein
VESVRATARPICKNLGKPGNDARAANRLAKKPFLFKDRSSDGANFCKLFSGRIEENQRLASEKVWIRDSSPSTPSKLRLRRRTATRRFGVAAANIITYSDNQKDFDGMKWTAPLA